MWFGVQRILPAAVIMLPVWLKRAALGFVLLLAQHLLPALIVEGDAGVGSTLHASAAERAEQAEKTRKTPALRQSVYEQLTEAQALAEKGEHRAALGILEQMRSSRRVKLNSYELANLYNLTAFIRYQQERYQQAIQAYSQVLAQPDLPLALETNTLYSLAQLQFVVEDYPAAIRMLQRWLSLAENPQPDVYVLLAQAYYQTRDYSRSLKHIEQALSLARTKGQLPKENWYLLQRALYYEKRQYRKVAQVLENLLRRWPRKDYLVQLSGVRGELGDTRGQVVAMETAHVAGMLKTEQEWLNLAYLYLGTGTPYKAAQLLERGIEQRVITGSTDHYRLLGNALRAAQERRKAIPALVRSAELATDGEPWAQLANIYLDVDDHASAARAARTALTRGKLRRPDQMRIALGTALFHLNQLPRAREQFEIATRDKRSRKIAGDWIDYLDSEQSRRASLQDDRG